MPQLYHFRYGGFHFASEVPLQSLPPSDRIDAKDTVAITIGSLPPMESIDPVGILVDEQGDAQIYAVGIGRFGVSSGTRIVVHVDSAVDPGAVEAVILGPVLGMLCFQRNILAFHTNAVLIHGQVVALCGRSGAGKSTLAAALLSRGHKLVSDDVLPVTIENTKTLATPGNQHLRLWGETLRHFGHPTTSLRRAAVGEREKYFLPPSGPSLTAKSPLAALIWLETGPAPVDKLELYSGVLRVQALAKAAYRREILREYVRLGRSGLADLSLPGVDVFQFWRRRGLDRLPQQAAMIEDLVSQRAVG